MAITASSRVRVTHLLPRGSRRYAPLLLSGSLYDHLPLSTEPLALRSFSSWILGDSYLIEGGTESLTRPTSEAHIPRDG